MSLPGSPPPAASAVELLDRAVAYTRGCLARVTPAALERPTPCTQWALLDLLVHLDDSLAALAEAAHGSCLSLAPGPRPVDASRLLLHLQQQACALVAQWISPGGPVVRLGAAGLGRETLGAVGALEITVHGWDVATALGLDRPIPPALALDLWPWALDHVTDADRPVRFAAPTHVPAWATPGTQLLALTGRRAAAT
ncbi:MAG: maleylpyruvate isomerase N-terminal domain-containing protein [Pedococcus sp.]